VFVEHTPGDHVVDWEWGGGDGRKHEVKQLQGRCLMLAYEVHLASNEPLK
jgi:hypothetical protein